MFVSAPLTAMYSAKGLMLLMLTLMSYSVRNSARRSHVEILLTLLVAQCCEDDGPAFGA